MNKTRKVYVTIGVTINNANLEDITDADVDDVIAHSDYSMGDNEQLRGLSILDTEVRGWSNINLLPKKWSK